ncbi:MAG TPA: DUF3761 domain-containing protein [Patescibacteria group bacterium]|jgi:hypothetical protein|nr:DUF3761 domain-containing protein [Patescibacteria group bacterium]
MEDTRSWYKKKRFLLPIGVVGVLTAIGIANANPQTQVQSDIQAPAPVVQEQQTQVQTPVVVPVETTATTADETQATTKSTAPLSNDNHYQNVDGDSIHSPAYTQDNSVPAGASAQCGDGTYSFSAHRSGTCSHHGGVATWY